MSKIAIPILVFIVTIAAYLFGQQKKDTSCHIGSTHNCHCPRMVARQENAVDEEALRKCRPLMNAGDMASYRACARAAGVMEACEVIANYDAKHKADNCSTACKTDSCRCHDGPPCTHFTFDIDRPPKEAEK
jgi:hypothetical protein